MNHGSRDDRLVLQPDDRVAVTSYQGERSNPMLCIGHSHVVCVARAAAENHVVLEALNFWNMPGAILVEDGKPKFSMALAEQLRQHAGAVFSMIGGAAHGVLGMLVHPRRFDFVLAAEPDLPIDPAAELLPMLAVRAMLKALMADYLLLMSELRRLCQGSMFHFEPPPPYADARRMHADIPWVMYPGMCQEISPAHFRYKLWRLHSQILFDWCANTGITFIACPPESMDGHGFMLEPYYGDGAHASDAYGALVLEQMRRRA